MKKEEDLYYIVYTNNGEILRLDSISDLYRKDIKLIIKRTYMSTSGGGQGVYRYYKSQILNENYKVKRSKNFNWNSLKCKLVGNDHYGLYSKSYGNTSVLVLEIVDHFNKRKSYSIRTRSEYKPFEEIRNILEIIDKVGTHQGYLEVKRLLLQIENLERKIKLLEN